MRHVLLFLSLFLSTAVFGVEFDEHTRQLPLGLHMDVFEDVRGDATLADITSPR